MLGKANPPGKVPRVKIWAAGHSSDAKNEMNPRKRPAVLSTSSPNTIQRSNTHHVLKILRTHKGTNTPLWSPASCNYCDPKPAQHGPLAHSFLQWPRAPTCHSGVTQTWLALVAGTEDEERCQLCLMDIGQTTPYVIQETYQLLLFFQLESGSPVINWMAHIYEGTGTSQHRYQIVCNSRTGQMEAGNRTVNSSRC